MFLVPLCTCQTNWSVFLKRKLINQRWKICLYEIISNPVLWSFVTSQSNKKHKLLTVLGLKCESCEVILRTPRASSKICIVIIILLKMCLDFSEQTNWLLRTSIHKIVIPVWMKWKPWCSFCSLLLAASFAYLLCFALLFCFACLLLLPFLAICHFVA